jgi:signal transduction histidine kinase
MPKNQNINIQDLEKKVLKMEQAQKYWRAQVELKEIEISELKKGRERLDEDLDNYIHTAAHELKSPTANLKLISYLLEKTSDPIEIAGYIDNIKSSIKRLDTTINSVVKGFEAHFKLVEDFENLGFDELVDEVKLNLLKKYPAPNGKFTLSFTDCPSIYFIKSHLVIILQALFENALKFRAKDRELEIFIKTYQVDGFIVLELKDNGIGINLTNNHIENLFKPFTKYSKKDDGVGMGLHMVKTLAEKNGGRVEVESSLGKGTTFRVFLKEYGDLAESQKNQKSELMAFLEGDEHEVKVNPV